MPYVEKRLKDADRTDGYQYDHHSREGVVALCHAAAGGDHIEEIVPRRRDRAADRRHP